MSKDIDNSLLYSEGCGALRHYSARVVNIRTLAIVQGLALLASAGYFLGSDSGARSLSLATFGLLFTGLLYSLQHNYWLHFQAILRCVLELEKQGREGQESDGPWTVYEEQRRSRHRHWLWSISAVHGPFLLLLLALLSIVISAIVKLLM